MNQQGGRWCVFGGTPNRRLRADHEDAITHRRASEIYRRETGTGWDVRRRILSHARVIVNRCPRWNTAQTDDGTVASASAMGVAAMMLVPIIILIVKDLQKPSAENEASSCVTRNLLRC
ncbi:uncharacterized protein K489DRAFT_35231 [Dissoconium aciculare CBS 342.82]|uniref:Uncharacterized protein n=1 Tax=Dissoconium aciculare CBS 342.82 TaxID=1314786 RepID=A0A6J3LXX1_9PEZI|nr:uncharacterized protein K489DRAFT_35231 [Dissoconium aciculare CBS 342.82]KAF1820528.1 hypothetical protein K489DRAFT_35231 [Dissoconium aciculare CBS 342.82]